MPVWPVVTSTDTDEHDEDRYKPDTGKNVIYHSFELTKPETASGGGIINQPETDADGNPVYLLDEFGELLLDWKGDPQLAYENARRVRFITQPKSKAGDTKTVLVTLYREAFLGGQMLPMTALLPLIAAAAISLGVGAWFFARLKPAFADEI